MVSMANMAATECSTPTTAEGQPALATMEMFKATPSKRAAQRNSCHKAAWHGDAGNDNDDKVEIRRFVQRHGPRMRPLSQPTTQKGVGVTVTVKVWLPLG